MDRSLENAERFPTAAGAEANAPARSETSSPIDGREGQVQGRGLPIRGRIPPKLYKIGEVAAYAGTSRQTIHNYTIMGLIQETDWSDGGHRLYDETVFPRLDVILVMRAQRRSMKDIRESLMGRTDRRT